MIAGVTDFLTGILKFPPADQAEIDRMAKPISRMIARRPQLQNVLKKWSAPAVFAGATFAYLAPRLAGTKQPAPPPRPRLQSVPGAEPTGAVAAASHGGPGEQSTPPPSEQRPTQDRAVAAYTENLLESLQASVPR